jgi:hypothetical protein
MGCPLIRDLVAFRVLDRGEEGRSVKAVERRMWRLVIMIEVHQETAKVPALCTHPRHQAPDLQLDKYRAI